MLLVDRPKFRPVVIDRIGTVKDVSTGDIFSPRDMGLWQGIQEGLRERIAEAARNRDPVLGSLTEALYHVQTNPRFTMLIAREDDLMLIRGK